MDIKKIQEIVENSQMTDEAKDLIYKLLEDVDKPGAKEEILKVIGYEIDMNETVADEADEVFEALQKEDKMFEAADEEALQAAKDLEEKTSEKMAKLDADKQEIEKDIAAFSVQTPVAEVVAPPVSAPVANAWAQPAVPVAAAPVANAWAQPAVPAATQPAPFPGNQAGQ